MDDALLNLVAQFGLEGRHVLLLLNVSQFFPDQRLGRLAIRGGFRHAVESTQDLLVQRAQSLEIVQDSRKDLYREEDGELEK